MAKAKKEIEKAVRKHRVIIFLFVLIFAGLGVGGFFVAKHITRNDKFEIVGEKTINLTMGQTYEDEGAVAISFGKDVSAKIKVEDNIDYATPGQYYIKYTVDDVRYKEICRYRIIIISEVGNG